MSKEALDAVIEKARQVNIEHNRHNRAVGDKEEEFDEDSIRHSITSSISENVRVILREVSDPNIRAELTEKITNSALTNLKEANSSSFEKILAGDFTSIHGVIADSCDIASKEFAKEIELSSTPISNTNKNPEINSDITNIEESMKEWKQNFDNDINNIKNNLNSLDDIRKLLAKGKNATPEEVIAAQEVFAEKGIDELKSKFETEEDYNEAKRTFKTVAEIRRTTEENVKRAELSGENITTEEAQVNSGTEKTERIFSQETLQRIHDMGLNENEVPTSAHVKSIIKEKFSEIEKLYGAEEFDNLIEYLNNQTDGSVKRQEVFRQFILKYKSAYDTLKVLETVYPNLFETTFRIERIRYMGFFEELDEELKITKDEQKLNNSSKVRTIIKTINMDEAIETVHIQKLINTMQKNFDNYDKKIRTNSSNQQSEIIELSKNNPSLYRRLLKKYGKDENSKLTMEEENMIYQELFDEDYVDFSIRLKQVYIDRDATYGDDNLLDDSYLPLSERIKSHLEKDNFSDRDNINSSYKFRIHAYKNLNANKVHHRLILEQLLSENKITQEQFQQEISDYDKQVKEMEKKLLDVNFDAIYNGKRKLEDDYLAYDQVEIQIRKMRVEFYQKRIDYGDYSWIESYTSQRNNSLLSARNIDEISRLNELFKTVLSGPDASSKINELTNRESLIKLMQKEVPNFSNEDWYMIVEYFSKGDRLVSQDIFTQFLSIIKNDDAREKFFDFQEKALDKISTSREKFQDKSVSEDIVRCFDYSTAVGLSARENNRLIGMYEHILKQVPLNLNLSNEEIHQRIIKEGEMYLDYLKISDQGKAKKQHELKEEGKSSSDEYYYIVTDQLEIAFKHMLSQNFGGDFRYLIENADVFSKEMKTTFRENEKDFAELSNDDRKEYRNNCIIPPEDATTVLKQKIEAFKIIQKKINTAKEHNSKFKQIGLYATACNELKVTAQIYAASMRDAYRSGLIKPEEYQELFENIEFINSYLGEESSFTRIDENFVNIVADNLYVKSNDALEIVSENMHAIIDKYSKSDPTIAKLIERGKNSGKNEYELYNEIFVGGKSKKLFDLLNSETIQNEPKEDINRTRDFLFRANMIKYKLLDYTSFNVDLDSETSKMFDEAIKMVLDDKKGDITPKNISKADKKIKEVVAKVEAISARNGVVIAQDYFEESLLDGFYSGTPLEYKMNFAKKFKDAIESIPDDLYKEIEQEKDYKKREVLLQKLKSELKSNFSQDNVTSLKRLDDFFNGKHSSPDKKQISENTWLNIIANKENREKLIETIETYQGQKEKIKKQSEISKTYIKASLYNSFRFYNYIKDSDGNYKNVDELDTYIEAIESFKKECLDVVKEFKDKDSFKEEMRRRLTTTQAPRNKGLETVYPECIPIKDDLFFDNCFYLAKNNSEILDESFADRLEVLDAVKSRKGEKIEESILIDSEFNRSFLKSSLRRNYELDMQLDGNHTILPTQEKLLEPKIACKEKFILDLDCDLDIALTYFCKSHNIEYIDDDEGLLEEFEQLDLDEYIKNIPEDEYNKYYQECVRKIKEEADSLGKSYRIIDKNRSKEDAILDDTFIQTFDDNVEFITVDDRAYDLNTELEALVTGEYVTLDRNEDISFYIPDSNMESFTLCNLMVDNSAVNDRTPANDVSVIDNEDYSKLNEFATLDVETVYYNVELVDGKAESQKVEKAEKAEKAKKVEKAEKSDKKSKEEKKSSPSSITQNAPEIVEISPLGQTNGKTTRPNVFELGEIIEMASGITGHQIRETQNGIIELYSNSSLGKKLDSTKIPKGYPYTVQGEKKTFGNKDGNGDRVME